MYAWATPEYILWHMTLGQVFLLHNRGVEIKYPDPNRKAGGSGLSYEELADAREEMRANGLLDDLERKYGDIDGDTRGADSQDSR